MNARTVTCPACKGRSPYGPENPWRPFCSRGCRAHDLGAWATESYRVPQRPSGDEEDLQADENHAPRNLQGHPGAH